MKAKNMYFKEVLKKMKLVLAFMFWLSLGEVSAQIVITGSEHILVLPMTDTLKLTSSASTFPDLSRRNDGVWDLSLLIDTVIDWNLFKIPISGSGRFVDSNGSNDKILTFVYPVKKGFVFTNDSLVERSNFVNSEVFSLAGFSGISSDSLFILSQSDTFTRARKILPFPLTVGQSWNSDYAFKTHFELNFSFDTFVHKPGYKKSNVKVFDSVCGWGAMRMNTDAGMPSDYWQVLQVQETEIVTDSFFIGDTTMSNHLLTLLGIRQGLTDTSYKVHFYRHFDLTPFATVWYRDAGFTQPYKVIRHMQDLRNLKAEDINSNTVSVFPNPLPQKRNTLYLKGTPGNNTYQIFSRSGTMVQLGVVSNESIELNTNILPGGYLLVVTDGENRSFKSTFIKL